MIASNHLLAAIDCDYLYGAVRELYGDQRRVSYLRVMELIKKDRQPGTVFHFHAFMAIKEQPHTHAQLEVVSRLSQWGFAMHTGKLAYSSAGEKTRDNLTALIIAFIKDFRCGDGLAPHDYPQTLVVASGSAALADLYDALLHFQVSVEVMTFGPLSTRILDVSRHVLLSDAVTFTPGMPST